MKTQIVQQTTNKVLFDHNKLSVPSLVQVDSLDEIDADFFFYLGQDELVEDKYDATGLRRIDKAIEELFRLADKLNKDIVYVPVSTVNYMPFPPKLLDFSMQPKLFRTSEFTPARLREEPDTKNKKSFHNIVLFNVFVQVKSNVEIGKEIHGTMPKFLEVGK